MANNEQFVDVSVYVSVWNGFVMCAEKYATFNGSKSNRLGVSYCRRATTR